MMCCWARRAIPSWRRDRPSTVASPGPIRYNPRGMHNRSDGTTVLDLGPAPETAVLLAVLAKAEVGCWFDRRASRGTSLVMVDPDQVIRDPFALQQSLQAPAAVGPTGFAGGWAGWLSYEGAQVGMRRGSVGGPVMLAHFPAVLTIDHRHGTAHAMGRGLAGEAAAWAWARRLRGQVPLRLDTGPPALLHPGPSPQAFMDQVRQVQAWIAEGQMYVANLTYRLELSTLRNPAGMYAQLSAAHPAPYASLLHDGDHWVLSSSPELLLRRQGPTAWSRPIKGTRPAGDSQGLLHDPKERAELTMIVDMVRNDLGQVATTGSVSVPEMFAIEHHPGIEHLVATVRAQVPTKAGALLAAMVPAGSVTGAPKARAVALLAELETSRRGVYTGAIGWCDDAGDMEWSVAIRTLESGIDGARYGTGGGITIDSIPEREYRETQLKTVGPLAAMGLQWR